MTRAVSRVRHAFDAAADGQRKAIALDAFPDVGAPEPKLTRSLAADGNLNPTWCLLEAIANANPEALLTELSHALGFEPPRRIPGDPAVVAQQMLEKMGQLEIQFSGLKEDVAKMVKPSGPRSVQPRRGAA